MNIYAKLQRLGPLRGLSIFFRSLFFAVSLALTACVTVPEGSLSLKEALQADGVVSLPIQIRKNGIIVLKGIEIGEKKFDFLMDTGATRSAVFVNTVRDIPQAMSSGFVNVHGLAEIETVEGLKIPDFRLGASHFLNLVVVILPNRFNDLQTEPFASPYDGLIGMDVLGHFALHIDRKNSVIHLIPNVIKTRIPKHWVRTDLFENPFGVDGKQLHFFTANIAAREVPALLDTGAEMSVVNWNEETYPSLKRFRQRLRESWQIQGAVGEFKPRTQVNLQGFSAGTIMWSNKLFMAMELDNLNVLGLGQDNMILAGVNLLDHSEIFMDFENDILAMRPKKGTSRPSPVLIQR